MKLLHMNSFPYNFLLVWAIFSLSFFFFFFSFFLLTRLVGMWHTFFGYASFISFCIARILDGNLEKESHVVAWSFILWWMEMLAIL